MKKKKTSIKLFVSRNAVEISEGDNLVFILPAVLLTEGLAESHFTLTKSTCFGKIPLADTCAQAFIIIIIIAKMM